MSARTPFFKDFHRQLFGRTSKQLAREVDALGSFALDRLQVLFGPFLPSSSLEINQKAKGKGTNSREAILTPKVTFWGFLSQVLAPNSSCREALAKIQALCKAQDQCLPQSDSSVYCKARTRLEKSELEKIHRHTANQLEANASIDSLWKGRRALLSDAASASMPDTAPNQKRWPQHSNQAKGCGFPTMKLVGLFSLASCALMDFAKGTLSTHENDLLYTLKDFFKPWDILVGDRLYCTFANICWLAELGVDLVARKNASRTKSKTLKRLGKNDQIVSWERPTNKAGHKGLTRLLWDKLKPVLRLREISFKVTEKGFRTREIVLITTLLDPEAYPADDIAELYLKRWRVELFFDDIKTSMQMDVLRCKSPEMIEKELLMHMIAYNLVRALMQNAATIHHSPLEAISFKGSVDRLRQWLWPITLESHSARRREMAQELLLSMAKDQLPPRPARYEPRVRKRRPKAYPVMVKPREEYRKEFRAEREIALAS